MKTPAPSSASLIASRTWSGVGEVNTAPHTAADNIPSPTKPACEGSCPLPPPQMRATFPDFSSLRAMISKPSTRCTKSL